MQSHLSVRSFHPCSQRGQSLVDALIGIAMVSMLMLTAMQISAVETNSSMHTQLISDVNQLYTLLSGIVSTEPSCQVAFGGSTASEPPIQTYNSVPLHIFKLSTSLTREAFIIPAIQPDNSVQVVKESLFNTLRINSISITPAPNPAAAISANTPFTAELSASVVPISQTAIPFPKNIRGIFMTVTVDATNKISTCGPMISTLNNVGNSAVIIPQCGANQAPTSIDGVTFTCHWTSCPSGKTGSTVNGWLNCS